MFGTESEGIIFALFLLVLSGLEIARLESKSRQAGRRAYLTRNRSITTVFVEVMAGFRQSPIR